VEWFIPGTEPTEYDTFYRRVVVDTATGLPAADAIPPERRAERVFLDLPPQAHDWARREGLPLLPDAFALVSASDPQGLIIASPDAQTVYRISPTLPLDAQRLRMVVTGPPGLHDVVFYVDGHPLGMVAAAPFELWWTLEIGTHTFYATGVTATGETITSEERPFTVNPPE
jgi:hypothetical protein